MTVPDLAVWAVEVTEEEKTMPETFSLTIGLGNDAMQTPDQIAAALRQVAGVLADRGDFNGPEDGTIRDYNGNSVGWWRAR